MKNIMWKYFTANNSQKDIDVLLSMSEKYNNTYHRSIKLTPSDAHNLKTISTYIMHSMLKLEYLHLNSMLVIKYV